MSNMSYCRFRNTLQDLQDCFEALTDMTHDELLQMKKNNVAEYNAMKELLELAKDIVYENNTKVNKADNDEEEEEEEEEDEEEDE